MRIVRQNEGWRLQPAQRNDAHAVLEKIFLPRSAHRPTLPHAGESFAAFPIVSLALRNHPALSRTIASPAIADREALSAFWPEADRLLTQIERPPLAHLFFVPVTAHSHAGRFPDTTIMLSANTTNRVPADIFRHGAFSGLADGDGISVVICGTGTGTGVTCGAQPAQRTANNMTVAFFISTHSKMP